MTKKKSPPTLTPLTLPSSSSLTSIDPLLPVPPFYFTTFIHPKKKK